MTSFIGKQLAKFRKGEKGAILVIAALLILPLTLMLGLAVDTSMGLEQKRRLQAAVDAAAKAGAANGNGQTITITSEAQKVFAANTVNMANIAGPNVTVSTSANTITVSASIIIPSIFMQVGGISSSTYTATTTVTLANADLAEVAIVYEVSERFLNSGFHQNICSALINFVNNLPNNVMVSITPIATEFILDPTTTVATNLFGNLSPTTNDESAYPALYPLSTGLAWTAANFALVTNPFYVSNSYPVLTSHPIPSTCPGGYASCPPLMWPLTCPPSTTNVSCSQVYTYISNPAYPILPLTLNRNLLVNYINGLSTFASSTDGVFPSYISWGWRTIDPNWNNFWLVNSSLTSTARAVGQYPQAYSKTHKSIIVILNGPAYWNDYLTDVVGYYSNTCGNAQTVVGGVNHWWMLGYGMVPVPTDYQALVDDITCQNSWYKTMDKSLGLTMSDATNYNATVNSTTYPANILTEVSNKFFRICNNIKAQNVDIYLLSNTSTSSLSACCNSSANAYTIANNSSSIATALSAVSAQIAAKVN